MGKQWYCKVSDKDVGPLTSDVIRQMVSRGEITPETLMRDSEGKRWFPASRINGLFSDSDAGNKGVPPTAVQGDRNESDDHSTRLTDSSANNGTAPVRMVLLGVVACALIAGAAYGWVDLRIAPGCESE